ncbi:DNA adenine methylase [Candidatus Bathyarchaeota archaeon]|nr:MAG: DNA adenine methylase [Candidatus Bathyarchaeota archaeon]
MEQTAKQTSQSRYPQPFVKWAGGKSQLLSQMSNFLPHHFDLYFEPFVGGGAVFFHLRPKRAVISDANFDLINAYRVIRDDLDTLRSELDELQEKRISRRLYELHRKKNPDKLSKVQRAARFIFLNKTCYNGLYRVNRKGDFNVPFGKYSRMPKLYEGANLIEIKRLLGSTEIEYASYETALGRASKGDFVYLDPPYSPDPKSQGFTSYTKESFSEVDQTRLAARFKDSNRRGCLLMLSNSDTRRVRFLYADFTIERMKAGRMINCIGSARTGYNELLILNYRPPVESLNPWVKGNR